MSDNKTCQLYTMLAVMLQGHLNLHIILAHKLQMIRSCQLYTMLAVMLQGHLNLHIILAHKLQMIRCCQLYTMLAVMLQGHLNLHIILAHKLQMIRSCLAITDFYAVRVVGVQYALRETLCSAFLSLSQLVLRVCLNLYCTLSAKT